jgi:superfamily II DNA or RNA helicase
MSLALRTRHAFPERVRRRGEAYAAAGRVELRGGAADELLAHVAGSERQPYTVRVTRDSGGKRPGLGVSCTCPYYVDRYLDRDLCKHVWAVIALLDRSTWADPLLRRAPERVRVVPFTPDPDAWPTEEPRALPPPRAQPRGTGARWQSRLAALADAAASRPRPALLSPVRESLCYAIDASASAGELVLGIYTRRRLRDGGLGVPSARSPRHQDVAGAETVEEARALELLLELFDQTRGRSTGGPGSLAVPPALHGSLLSLLAETGRLALETSRSGWGRPELAWLTLDRGAPFSLRLALERGPSGFELRGRLERGEETILLDDVRLALASGFFVHADALARWEGARNLAWFTAARDGIRAPAREVDAFVEELLVLPDAPPLELPPELGWSVRATAPAPRLRFERFAGKSSAPLPARLQFLYGAAAVSASSPASRVCERAARVAHDRDLAAEAEAAKLLASLGFERVVWAPEGAAALQLPPGAFEPAVAELLGKGWQIEAEGVRLRRASRSWASVTSDIDFFEVDGGVEFDGETAPFPALLAAARDGERYVRLGDGSRGLLPRDWLARAGALAGFAGVEDERLRFARSQAALLDVWLEAQQEVEVDPGFAALRAKLRRFSGIEPRAEPNGFVGVLRGYQREGVGWLEFLREFGLNGCLADDMGLGKTVQVLALLVARKAAGTAGPSLVVAPRSVVHNWLDEAARFAPGLTVLEYTGTERVAQRDRISEHDLVLTTYGTLRRDVEALAAVRFDYAILDEAQAIKNAASRTAKSARALRAGHRLALTGTPVENHLGELGSLFEFLNPGMLGRSNALRALARPGAAREDGALEALARALRPFILRRVKTDVLAELPEKTEQAIVCELGKEQRRLYDELRDHYRASLGARIAKHGLARSKLHVLEALLRLRQAACHPALVAPRFADAPSTKLETLFAQLEEVVAASHKALVFSQFTQLLAHVRAGLDARGIAYEYLDGKTRDRKSRVERFQANPACPVFLISLKAGGVGLNLTAAEYVFLLDPWWNPAVEAQAIDRAHRIGQTRPVFAYRLIARGTVEEKILELQEKKRRLVEAVFAENAGGLAGLTAEDLERLLG